MHPLVLGAGAQVRIGISGWRYGPWRGVFYPEQLRQADELWHASRAFSSIELNGSFYSLQRPQSYTLWRDSTPDEFVFAVKGGRYITHMKRLDDVDTALANFFASGLLCLGHKLGPVLWQLPPQVRFDAERLDRFLRLLPRDTHAAEALAKAHDRRLDDRNATQALVSAPLRHTLEVRHESFVCPEFFALLREHRVACCVADSAGRFPFMDEVTADFVYVRLHGSKQLYVSGYSPAELRQWAARILAWAQAGRDVYMYFDNDAKVRAPFDAMNLARVVSGRRIHPLPASLRATSAGV